VDCSGFGSVLLGKALGEPFESYKSSLFCDRAVVGGWQRGRSEPILPYTLCETMDAGWCWQIEHEHRINRGYVYSSGFISDEAAEREFRARNPKVGPTRIVKFISGRYRRTWVKNVVAIGNSAGFVEPLEATALAVIGQEAQLLADTLADGDRHVRPTQVNMYNVHIAKAWDVIRRFLAVHYKFNKNRDTEFWRHCWENTDLAGAEPIVEYYRENGPTALYATRVLGEVEDQFSMAGYVAMLLGQRVPYRRTRLPTDQEMAIMRARRERNRHLARHGLTVEQALAMIRSPEWDWNRFDLNSGTSGSVRVA
jgi:tryptophan halogenase